MSVVLACWLLVFFAVIVPGHRRGIIPIEAARGDAEFARAIALLPPCCRAAAIESRSKQRGLASPDRPPPAEPASPANPAESPDQPPESRGCAICQLVSLLGTPPAVDVYSPPPALPRPGGPIQAEDLLCLPCLKHSQARGPPSA